MHVESKNQFSSRRSCPFSSEMEIRNAYQLIEINISENGIISAIKFKLRITESTNKTIMEGSSNDLNMDNNIIHKRCQERKINV